MTKRFWRRAMLTMTLATMGYAAAGTSSAVLAGEPGAPDGKFGLGREATGAEIAAWDIDVRPDGAGLPAGSGSVADGEGIYIEKCAVCHGDFGEGAGRWPVLAGGAGSLASDDPVKTVGSYWPYLSTVYDYVNRAMPFGAAQTLEADEVYAITAYILYLNDLVDDEFVLSKETFADVANLPNVENFYMDDRETSPLFSKRDVCMTDCKSEVRITRRAAVLDVTPEGGENPSGEAVVSAEDAAGDPEPTETAAAAETASAAESAAAPDPALVAAGEKVWKKCKACHQVGDGAKHRVGPILTGIYGRKAGTIEGFKKYSKAMKAARDAGLVWTDATLVSFLAKPRAFMKGTKMAFAGLKKDEDLAAIVAFLKAHSE